MRVFSKKRFLFLTAVASFFLFGLAGQTFAAPVSILGWMWSDTIGWIDLNPLKQAGFKNLLTSFSQGVAYPYNTFSATGNTIFAVETSANTGGAISNSVTLDVTKTYTVTYTLTLTSGTAPNIRYVGSNSGRSNIIGLDGIAQIGTNSLTFAPVSPTGYLEISVGSGSVTNFEMTDIRLGLASSALGVKKEDNGDITGYAWSDNVGWVKFGGLSGFPTGGGTTASNARVTGSGAVEGWARACSGTLHAGDQSLPGNCSSMTSRTDGFDGWISLRGAEYGVTFTGNELSSWGWGADTLGWFSFIGSGAPVNLATDPGDCDTNSVTLSWDRIPGATKYFLYRYGGDSSATTSVPQRGDDPITHTNAGLLPGSLYTYRVSAVYGTTESPPSALISEEAPDQCPPLLVQRVRSPDEANMSGTKARFKASGETWSSFSKASENPAEFSVSSANPSTIEVTKKPGYAVTAGICHFNASASECQSPMIFDKAVNATSCSEPSGCWSLSDVVTPVGQTTLAVFLYTPSLPTLDLFVRGPSDPAYTTTPAAVTVDSSVEVKWRCSNAANCAVTVSPPVSLNSITSSGGYNFQTSGSLADVGTYTFTLCGDGLIDGMEYCVSVPVPTVSVTGYGLTCGFYPPNTAPPVVGRPLTFTAYVLHGLAPFTIRWRDSDGLDYTTSATSITRVYSKVGAKTVTIDVTDSFGEVATCVMEADTTGPNVKIKPTFDEY